MNFIVVGSHGYYYFIGRFLGYIQFRPEKSFNYLILKTPYLQNLRFRPDSILGYMHFRPAVPVVLNKIY
jgi:hypothetical protein